VRPLDEPWDPSPLTVGERVQVRLSGEDDWTDNLRAHLNGAMGEVTEVDRARFYTYRVRLGEGDWSTRFSRIELDRVP
jgi:hypothetical protein